MLAGLEVFVEIDGQTIGLSPQRCWQDVLYSTGTQPDQNGRNLMSNGPAPTV
jgi:hypothetical protein